MIIPIWYQEAMVCLSCGGFVIVVGRVSSLTYLLDPTMLIRRGAVIRYLIIW